jgi:hypothetical protein
MLHPYLPTTGDEREKKTLRRQNAHQLSALSLRLLDSKGHQVCNRPQVSAYLPPTRTIAGQDGLTGCR